jgi:Phage endonuclease I
MTTKLKFRSKFEKAVYEHAREHQRCLEYEPANPSVYYTTTARYIPDFRLPNGVLVESKGYFSARDRRKMLQVVRDNPELDIRLVFQRANNRLTKSPNSMTYGQWCDKHGFQ